MTDTNASELAKSLQADPSAALADAAELARITEPLEAVSTALKRISSDLGVEGAFGDAAKDGLANVAKLLLQKVDALGAIADIATRAATTVATAQTAYRDLPRGYLTYYERQEYIAAGAASGLPYIENGLAQNREYVASTALSTANTQLDALTDELDGASRYEDTPDPIDRGPSGGSSTHVPRSSDPRATGPAYVPHATAPSVGTYGVPSAPTGGVGPTGTVGSADPLCSGSTSTGWPSSTPGTGGGTLPGHVAGFDGLAGSGDTHGDDWLTGGTANGPRTSGFAAGSVAGGTGFGGTSSGAGIGGAAGGALAGGVTVGGTALGALGAARMGLGGGLAGASGGAIGSGAQGPTGSFGGGAGTSLGASSGAAGARSGAIGGALPGGSFGGSAAGAGAGAGGTGAGTNAVLGGSTTGAAAGPGATGGASGTTSAGARGMTGMVPGGGGAAGSAKDSKRRAGALGYLAPELDDEPAHIGRADGLGSGSRDDAPRVSAPQNLDDESW